MESIENYLTARELGDKWNVSIRMISHYCSSGMLKGAVKRGNLWLIPMNVNKPLDHRRKGNRKENDSV